MSGHRYTGEEHVFMSKFIPGHTYLEIQAEFIKTFGWDISISQIKGYMANHRINSGTKGHFTKGHVPANKGKKGACANGCEKSWFRPGHTPQNHRPVGSERVSKDGYVELKIAEPDQWKLKHRVIWEGAFGQIPKGKCIIFLNGIKTDVRLENLMAIDRKVHARMNQNGLRYKDEKCTKAAVGMAELLSAIGEAKRKL